MNDASYTFVLNLIHKFLTVYHTLAYAYNPLAPARETTQRNGINKINDPKVIIRDFRALRIYIRARARARFPSDNYAATQKEAEKKAA